MHGFLLLLLLSLLADNIIDCATFAHGSATPWLLAINVGNVLL